MKTTPLFTADELRQITNKAVAEAKTAKAANTQQMAEAHRREQAKQALRAKELLAKLNQASAKAANEGKTTCTVFRLTDADCMKPLYSITKDIPVEEMDGAALIMATTCQRLGYKVVGRYGWDGGGMSSWHDFVVSW
jgi:hypothetical protein